MLDFKKIQTGKVPYIKGDLTVEDWNDFIASEHEWLMLNSALGWDGDIGALREVRNVSGRGLHILPLGKNFDVASLIGISGISYLYLGLGCKGSFNICDFADLRELRNLADTKDLKASLKGGSHLTRLVCNGGHMKDPRVLGEISSLRSLEVIRPSFEPQMIPDGLGVEYVDFYAWTKLKDLQKLSNLPLRGLRLSACKRIEDYSALADMHSLESIFLDDCASIPSANIFAGMKSLRELVFQGTEFIDKDISCLAKMNLDIVRMSGKGYVPPHEDLACKE